MRSDIDRYIKFNTDSNTDLINKREYFTPNVVKKYIDEAIIIANRSCMTFKHGAVIIKAGKIIGKGFNYGYNQKVKGYWSMHAERSAILDCLIRKIDLSGRISILSIASEPFIAILLTLTLPSAR